MVQYDNFFLLGAVYAKGMRNWGRNICNWVIYAFKQQAMFVFFICMNHMQGAFYKKGSLSRVGTSGWTGCHVCGSGNTLIHNIVCAIEINTKIGKKRDKHMLYI